MGPLRIIPTVIRVVFYRLFAHFLLRMSQCKLIVMLCLLLLLCEGHGWK